MWISYDFYIPSYGNNASGNICKISANFLKRLYMNLGQLCKERTTAVENWHNYTVDFYVRKEIFVLYFTYTNKIRNCKNKTIM